MLHTSRRRFLQATSALAASSIGSSTAIAEGPAGKPLKFRLGIVTYNIAAKWDVPTILKICKSVGLSPVELRTTHAHGVEPSLSKDRRKEVKKQFTRSEER